MQTMQTMFLILIGSVFILSITFAILIWRQLIKFEKKALAAKQRQKEHIRQFEVEQEPQLAKESMADAEKGTKNNKTADN